MILGQIVGSWRPLLLYFLVSLLLLLLQLLQYHIKMQYYRKVCYAKSIEDSREPK